ncbi:MAG: hypothetical protein QMC95_17820 [Desulfitobacteriaceae bacterium]|nr:hypothetical protein [Desulfitobacteriaceae bacterium]
MEKDCNGKLRTKSLLKRSLRLAVLGRIDAMDLMKVVAARSLCISAHRQKYCHFTDKKYGKVKQE